MEIDEALVAQQQVVRLQALLEASRQLHSTIELDEVLRIALEIVVRELELTGAFFTTFPQTYGEVSPEFQASLHHDASESARSLFSESFLRFKLCDKSGEPFAELIVLLPTGRVLDLDETDFLESLAVQASVAIENARFHARALQWQRVESDLAAARQVQLSLIPQEMPTIPNYSIAARSVTCYEVGGDYLDIVSLPSGETVIVVADVAGKGLASALMGTSFRSAIRAMVLAGLDLREIATQMNLLHYGEGDEARRRYVTGILFRLDPAAHTLEAVNAGHTTAFLVTPEGDLTSIKASSTPFGLLPFSNYVAQTFPLSPGARLLVYTDGMTEVFSGEDEFGETRLLKTFLACNESAPDEVLGTIWNTLEAFSDGQEQSDDMTALVLARESVTETGNSVEEPRKYYEIQLPSRLGSEKLAMATAADLARSMGFDDERIEDLKTAVAEACINAMEHGNKLDETLPVGVILSRGHDSLEVRVIDTGQGPQQHPAAPDIDQKMHEHEHPRGMGMFLIESLVDEAEWGRTPCDGSYARMVIRLKADDEDAG
jgi:serine phosphatase RsbU (regulator of sigma subunit)/anti-sigma regulatory factor (Ser/Thr protein kinase)